MPRAWLSFATSAPDRDPDGSDEWTLIGEWGAHHDEALRKSVQGAKVSGPLAFYLSLDPECDWVASFLEGNPNVRHGMSPTIDPGPLWLALDKFGPGVANGPFYVVSAQRAKFAAVGTRPPESHPGRRSPVVNVGIRLPSKAGRHFRPLGSTN